MSHSEPCSVKELVDGVVASPGAELDAVLTDPDTGEALHPQRASAPGSVEAALVAAARVHDSGAWLDLPVQERADALRALQGKLSERSAEMAEADSLDSGVPLAATSAFTGAGIGLLAMAAAAIEAGFGHEEVTSPSVGGCDQWSLPWGPAAVLVPWNAPAISAIKKVAEGLVAGCPIVVKPSEWAPHFSGALADAAAEALPPGAVQIVHGGADVGRALVEDQRIGVVSYTGGVAGGTAVAEICARQMKPADLELSGNNPVVVLPDADPDVVVANVVMGMTMLNGQYCVGPRRLIVREDQAATYVDAFAIALDALQIGATTDPASQMGPLNSEVHRRKVEGQIAEYEARGCEVRRFGKLPDAGHFVPPTVIFADAAPDLKDEIFGPVIQVRTYRDLDEAVTIANDHAFGLSGYVFGNDRDAARRVGRKLRGGLIRLNSLYGALDVAGVGSAWGISGSANFALGETTKSFTGHRWVS